MPYRQRGVVGIVSVIVLLVVIALMVQVILERSTTNLIDSSLQSDSLEAEFLAESGVERAAWRYTHEEVLCESNGMGETDIEMIAGSGNTVTLASYKTDILGATLDAGKCRMVATATMANNGISRTINAIIIGNVLIEDQFPDISRWSTAGPTGDTFYTNCPETTSVTAQTNDGTVAFDADTSVADGTGSLMVSTPDGNALEQTGYRTWTNPSKQIPEDSRVYVSFDFKKDEGNKSSAMVLAVDLVSTVGDVYRVECNSQAKDFAWTSTSSFMDVPTGKTIDTVRISFHILNDSKASAVGNSMSIDNLLVRWTCPPAGC